MKTIFAFALALIPFISVAQELSVKSEGVKITFVADMQNTSGSVAGFAATIKFNMDDLAQSSITGTVDVNTLNTGNNKRDNHLKSADFFDAEKYPTMSFKSTSITKKDNGFVMEGILKIKDVERKEIITFTYENNVFSAECTIQAANYDLGSFAKKKPEKTNVKITFAIPVK